MTLKPCPICKGNVEKFEVRQSTFYRRFSVIHCPKGCKPHWNSVVVHLRSIDVPEWDNVEDAWNTMEVKFDNGIMKVSFDYYPPNKKPIVADGRYSVWPRITSKI